MAGVGRELQGGIMVVKKTSTSMSDKGNAVRFLQRTLLPISPDQLYQCAELVFPRWGVSALNAVCPTVAHVPNLDLPFPLLPVYPICCLLSTSANHIKNGVLSQMLLASSPIYINVSQCHKFKNQQLSIGVPTYFLKNKTYSAKFAIVKKNLTIEKLQGPREETIGDFR